MNILYRTLLSLVSCTAIALSQELPTSTPTLEEEAPVASRYLPRFKINNLSGLSGRIAFSALIETKQFIYLLDLNTRKISALVSDQSKNYYPSWSHDGQKLAFTSDRDGNNEIYIINWEGNEQIRVTNTPNINEEAPHWSPDGTELVYTAIEGKRSLLTRHNLISNTTSNIELGGRNSVPRWSHDNKSIAFTTDRYWPGWDVCLWSLPTQKEICVLRGLLSYCRADWSSDNGFLAYSKGLNDEIDIATYDMKTGKEAKISGLPGREYDAVWGPGDKHIAFVAEANSNTDIFNIFVAEVGKEKLQHIVESEYSIRYLSWSPQTLVQLESARIKAAETATLTQTPTPSISPTPNVTE